MTEVMKIPRIGLKKVRLKAVKRLFGKANAFRELASTAETRV